MKYLNKAAPRREGWIQEVKLIGHTKVRITIGYSTESKETHTWWNQEFDFELCDIRYLGEGIQRVVKGLRDQLDDFKRSVSEEP